MKEKKERLELRVTKSEKSAICRKAAKCGLTISEYVRKRALGYEPRGAPTDALFDITGRLSELTNGGLSPEAEKAVLDLLTDIRRAFFESEGM